jgi:hypothetical protein
LIWLLLLLLLLLHSLTCGDGRAATTLRRVVAEVRQARWNACSFCQTNATSACFDFSFYQFSPNTRQD